MMLSDRWALVTGASSGLGLHFAEQLASAGMHVITVARRADRLEALSEQLGRRFGVDTRAIATDLSQPSAPRRLHEGLLAEGIHPHVLINNAGYAITGRFATVDAERARGQVELNAAALTELARRFVEPMKQRGEGFVLNVSSIQAFMSVPGYATDAATKAYILHLSEALHDELAPHGVVVTCLCPGPTDTEFYDVAGHHLPRVFSPLKMHPRAVARQGLDALFAGKRTVIPGLLNKLIVAQLRALPAPLQTRVAGRLIATLDGPHV